MGARFRKFLSVGVIAGFSFLPAFAYGYTQDTAHIGEIEPADMEAYHERMRSAMSFMDPVRRDEAVIRARQHLAVDTGKPLSAGTIAEVDGLLDIGGISPQLGASG